MGRGGVGVELGGATGAMVMSGVFTQGQQKTTEGMSVEETSLEGLRVDYGASLGPEHSRALPHTGWEDAPPWSGPPFLHL